MQLPSVIGLTGKKRAGKNVLAASLEQYGYETAAFADPLKDRALRLNPIIYFDREANEYVGLDQIVAECGWEHAKDSYPEVRRILQYLGTDVIRAIDPDYWVRQMEYRLVEADLLGQKMVVADVRFENEANLIRKWGGIIVEIQRPNLVQSFDSHISESGVAADCVIMNTGPRDELIHEFLRVVADL